MFRMLVVVVTPGAGAVLLTAKVHSSPPYEQGPSLEQYLRQAQHTDRQVYRPVANIKSIIKFVKLFEISLTLRAYSHIRPSELSL